jgi:hypothetical protein
MNKKINTVRVSLRLSPALHKRLQERAQHERRSLHGQIVWLLEHTITAPAAERSSSDRARHAVG